ncbi:MAG: hypothetical protein ACYC5H_02210 [Methylovirgula sp.]
MIDELHLAVAPVVLGRGEAMFTNIDLATLGFHVIESTLGEQAMHVVLERFSIGWNRPIERKTLQFNKLEHVLGETSDISDV